MKKIDYWLQAERMRQAQKYLVGTTLLDIGCHLGALFEKTQMTGDGIDLILQRPLKTRRYTLWPGRFPHDFQLDKKYDNICLLAVLEHIPLEEVALYPQLLHRYLNPKGRVVVTVPMPVVDVILKVLLWGKLIDGMEVNQHQKFDRSLIVHYFTTHGYQLIHAKRFELGLNQLYVFEKSSA